MTNFQRTSHPNSPQLWIYGFWALTFAVILPVWLLEYLPLVDLPLHIARAHVLHAYGSNPFLKQVYDLVIEPIPNVGAEVVMMGLQWILPIGIAMKLMISVILLLFCTGIREIFRIFASEVQWLPLLAPLIAYHTMFVYGFLNYVLGLGLFFWTFSLWYRWSSGKSSIINYLSIALLAAACYFAHLSSYAFLGVTISTVLAYELIAKTGLFMSRLKLALASSIPMILFVLFMGGSGTNSGVAFSDLRGKFTTLLMLITSYDKTFDLVLLIALVVIVLIAFFSARNREINKQAMTLAVVFAICFALCPATLFTSNLADARLVPVLYVFLLCAVRLEFKPMIATALVATLLIAFSIRSLLIVQDWNTLSSELDRQLKIAEVLPEGSHVRPLYYYEDVVLNKQERPFRHMLSYKMIDRDLVLASFIGLPGQQPIVFKQQPTPVLLEKSIPLTNVGLDTLQRDYDYIWAYKLLPAADSILALRYQSIVRKKDVTVYKIR